MPNSKKITPKSSKFLTTVKFFALLILGLSVATSLLLTKSITKKQEYHKEVLAAETQTFFPSEDAHVKSNYLTSNYGTVDKLITSNFSATNTQVAYMKFDLSSLAGKTITSASITVTPTIDRKVEKVVRLVPDVAWQESKITWSNKPVMATNLGTLFQQNTKAGTPITISLDTAVIQPYSGKTFSLGFDNTSSEATLDVYSSEAQTGKPVLTITTDGTGLPTTPVPTATPIPTIVVTPNPTIAPTATLAPTPIPTTNPPTSQLPAVIETDPRITCSKYPEKRVFLETQAWWMDTESVNTASQIPLDGIGGHTHTATCFPQDQLVADGKIKYDVRLMLHKGNVGKVNWLQLGDAYSNVLTQVNFNPPLECPGGSDPKKMCEVWIPVEVDTSKMKDGYQEMRVRFNVQQPNGERQFASTGWEAFYRTKVGYDRRYPYLEARGWYTGANYANARLLTPVPYEPVSGKWSLKVGMIPGSEGVPITSSSVHIDAKFNLNSFGWTIMEANGPFTGTITIDTTKLSNGLHYVAVKSDQDLSNGGTNTGILQFPIIVQN